MTVIKNNIYPRKLLMKSLENNFYRKNNDVIRIICLYSTSNIPPKTNDKTP